MEQIRRHKVIMPGGIELTREAEPYLDLGPSTNVLSVAEERDNYRRDQEHLGVGLWVVKKEGEPNG